MTSWVFDIEANGLDPDRIYCLCARHVDGGEVFATTDYDQMRKMLLGAEVLIGHNIARWDIPVLEHLLDIKIKATIIDTLALSWVLRPERLVHGLESYGEDFGIPKPVITDWINLTIEEYIHRCTEDVKINWQLWKEQLNYLLQIYETKDKLWPYLKYLEFKMDCAREQERSRWKLDVEYVKKSLEDMLADKEQRMIELIEIMPRMPVYAVRSYPKVFYTKDGKISANGQKWLDLCSYMGLPQDHTEDVKVVTKTVPGNPNSSGQIKQWLFDLGWVPQHIKHDKDSKGNPKEIPQIASDKKDGSICPSVQMLYDKEPNLELLEGYTVLSHRISVLKGFLENVSLDGYVKARIQGITNTLRFQHGEVVNLPKVEKLYGKQVRGALTVPEGYILIGADMSSLEDRLKHHFLYPHDPNYVIRMSVPTYDPHIALAEMGNMITKAQGEFYVRVDGLLAKSETKGQVTEEELKEYKLIKAIRSIAKNGNYACQYGAGAPRIALTAGISLDQAKIVWQAYWDLNWAIRKVAGEQLVKEVNGQKWLYNPISGFWYSLRYEKDRFSTLIQGSASFVFDKWVYNFRQHRPQLTGQFHDEVVLCVLESEEAEVTKLLNDSINLTNNQLNLNRELGIGVQSGKRYSEIH